MILCVRKVEKGKIPLTPPLKSEDTAPLYDNQFFHILIYHITDAQ